MTFTEVAIRFSLDSTRPFMAPSIRTSRYSTYSNAPSMTPTEGTADSTQAEINEITSGLRRMENKALSKQRVVLSEDKVERMGKLALGAKLERALDRRMSSQDAVMRPRRKTTSEVPTSLTDPAKNKDAEKIPEDGPPASIAEESSQTSLVYTKA